MQEILAPAGDADAFYAALNSGADAIYIGLKNFSARRSAANFPLEKLQEYTARAHVVGAKVYVALNTLVKDSEIDDFFACALAAWNAGADALIIQDMFLGKLLKRTYPEMVLHLSTQAGVCNLYGARLAKRFGFSRVILARETPLEDIAKISSEIETEVFVQGALCTCFSGQCYLSSFAGGNSGNRGLCKQPCRKKYSVDRKGFEQYSYALSLSDLSVGEKIFDLIKAGVSSFKIEGRMRSAAYVGAAVQYYKDLLSGALQSTLRGDFSDLKRTYNRGDYTSGYAFGQDKNLLSRIVQGHKGEMVGRVSAVQKNEKYTFFESGYSPSEGDGFKVIRREVGEVGGGEYRADYPKARGGFYLKRNANFRAGDAVYLTSDAALSRRIAEKKRTIALQIDGRFAVGEKPRVRLSGGFGSFDYTADFIVDPAINRTFVREDFEACFSKTDDFPFTVSFGDIRIEGNGFMVKSALNAFRRGVFSSLFARLSAPRQELKNRGTALLPRFHLPSAGNKIAVIDRGFSSDIYKNAPITDAVFKPKNYKDWQEIQSFIENAEYYAWRKWLYLPAFMVGEDLETVLQYVRRFDGVYAEGAFALEFCREQKIALFAGTGFNLFNSLSVQSLYEEGAAEAALSKELAKAELSRIRGRVPDLFVFAGGSVKVMELGHCLFGKSCASCDRRSSYLLTDEGGRTFPLLRYENSICRFEVYNASPLVSDLDGQRIYDFCALSDTEKAAYLFGKNIKEALKSYTTGALRGGIL